MSPPCDPTQSSKEKVYPLLETSACRSDSGNLSMLGLLQSGNASDAGVAAGSRKLEKQKAVIKS